MFKYAHTTTYKYDRKLTITDKLLYIKPNFSFQPSW